MSNCNVEYHWDYEGDQLINKKELNLVIKKAIADLDFYIDHVALIFVDDIYLKNLHAKYLNDPTITDVMTFDLRDEDSKDVEIYISVDTAQRQSSELKISVREELLRYVLHGILHIAGYNDDNPDDQAKMKLVENEMVKKYSAMIN